MTDARAPAPEGARDFIRQIIDRDLAEGRYGGRIVTRFPPEPNGYLHIGHAKSIVLNFGLAEEFEGARCHLRFDDTNPTTEDLRYVESIQEDVRWLGYDWGEHLYFASDYFEEMYGFAEELVRRGLAYVDSRPETEIRESRGTVTEPGRESPYRDRPAEESLDRFRRMRAGEFRDGEHVLRARIDMAAPNMLMRDPVLFRIRHAEHYRTGTDWCVYPLYDFAHPLGDALECVTHSLCTLEFENNRELYDWVVERTGVPCRPRQYEFARLNLDYTVLSKRKLLRLVGEGDVEGWDDPRMPTLAGLRRRGLTPEAIRSFCEMIGVAKADSRVDMGKLEYAVRDDLNRKAPRVLAVLRPLPVTLTNWPEGKVEELEAPYFPRDVPLEGSRTVPFSGELLIDRGDFAEDPPPGFRRLIPGGEVRLRYGYVIRCEEVVKDGEGEVVELRCTYDPATRGGRTPDGRRVKGTVQWVSKAHAVPLEVRLYDRLFSVPDPDAAAARAEEGDFRDFLNPGSLEIVRTAMAEPSIRHDPEDTRYQFERLGFFWRDPALGDGDPPVFNRIVTLRDTWARRVAGPSGSGRGGEAARRPKPAPGGPGSRPPLSPAEEARVEELRESFGLEEAPAEVLARDPELGRFFQEAVGRAGDAAGRGDDPPPPSTPALANWVINEFPSVQEGRAPGELPFGPREFTALVGLVEAGVLSGRGGKDVLEVLAREGGEPRAIVERLGLVQLSDAGDLAPVVDEVLAAHPEKVEAFRGGREGLLGFFMGQVMRRTGGRADPTVAKDLLRERLG